MKLSEILTGEPRHEQQSEETAALMTAETRMDQLSAVLQRAMAGEMSRNRPLKYWENLKLRPQHLQMILMKGSGMSNRMIAEAFGMTDSRVSVIVNHPDALSLLSVLVSYAAENVLDINTRIKAHAGEALDVALDIMRSSKDDRVRSSVAFDILDRAGYGKVEKKAVTHEVQLPSQAANVLAQVAKEAMEVEGEWNDLPGSYHKLPSASEDDVGERAAVTQSVATPPGGAAPQEQPATKARVA